MSSTNFNNPFEILGSHDFVAGLESYYNDYIVFVEKELDDCVSKRQIITTDKDDFLTRAKNAALILIKILQSHRQGNIATANYLFDELMKALSTIFSKQTFDGAFKKATSFFRIRQDEVINENKYSIFHIPFNLRRKVANLRFNAPGFPCLYCANNLETAWIECRRPGLTSFTSEKKFLNAAVFNTSEEIFYVDLSYKDFNILRGNATNSTGELVEFVNYLQLYPLISALHCKVIYDASEWVNFHYEYLLPTMFMHWFINDKEGSKLLPPKLMAIKYSSVENFHHTAHYNVAIPAKFSAGLEYCSVLERIFLSRFKNYYHREIGGDSIDIAGIIKLEDCIIKLLP